MYSKRKLQGASLFFLFAAIYWALSETGREDPSGRRTGASWPVYGFPKASAYRFSADYYADAVRSRADMPTGALERAARVPRLVRAQENHGSDCDLGTRCPETDGSAVRRVEEAGGGRRPDEEAAGLLHPDSHHQRDPFCRHALDLHPGSELVGHAAGRRGPGLRVGYARIPAARLRTSPDVFEPAAEHRGRHRDRERAARDEPRMVG